MKINPKHDSARRGPEIPPPWDYPGFIIIEGRYYSQMFFVPLGASSFAPRGGNITAMLWRFDAEAPDQWIFTHRIRYYADDKLGNDSEDQRIWAVAKSVGSERDVRRHFWLWCTAAAGLYSKAFGTPMPVIDELFIHGDGRMFFDAVEKAKKPWMHMSRGPKV